MNIKDALSEKIAGEITFSPRPGQTIRKWRGVFGLSQTDLANYLKLSPSVISDYESGRRKSPGIQTVKKIIKAFIEIDEKHGGKVLHQYNSMVETQEGILEIMEYPFTISAEKFIEEIEEELDNEQRKRIEKINKDFENPLANFFDVASEIMKGKMK